MKILKRMAAAAMAGVLALTLLAGCAGGGGSATTGVSSETIAANLGLDYSAEVEQKARALAKDELSASALKDAFSTGDEEFSVSLGSVWSQVITGEKWYCIIGYDYANDSCVSQIDNVLAFTVTATEDELFDLWNPLSPWVAVAKAEVDRYNLNKYADAKAYFAIVPMNDDCTKWLVVVDIQVVYSTSQPLSEID